MILKKKQLKKNSSCRKLISYSTEFRLDINLNNFVGQLCAASSDKCVSRYIYDRPPRPPDGTSVTRYFKLSPEEFVTWY